MVDKKLKQLRRTRGDFKHRLTNFVNFFNLIQEKFNQNKNICKATLLDLKFRTDNLKTVLLDFERIQDKTECICDDDHLNKEYDERGSFFDTFSSILVAAQIILNDYSKAESDDASIIILKLSQFILDQMVYNKIISLPHKQVIFLTVKEFKELGFQQLIYQNLKVIMTFG